MGGKEEKRKNNNKQKHRHSYSLDVMSVSPATAMPLYRDDHDGSGREAFMAMLSALNNETATSHQGAGGEAEDDGEDQPPLELGKDSEVRTGEITMHLPDSAIPTMRAS